MNTVKKVWEKYKESPVQVKASLWFTVCTFVQKAISMLTTPIFTRLLTPEEFGLFHTFSSWYGILTIVLGLSLTSGVHTQGLVKFSDDKRRFTSSLLGLTTTLLIFWTILYFAFCNQWNALLKMPTLQVGAMLIMVWTSSSFNFWANEQRVGYRYRNLVIVTIIVSLAKPLLGIFLVTHTTNKVDARIMGLVAVELVCYTWMFFKQMGRGKVFYSKKYWLYALGFNIPLVPHYLSQTVLSSADRIMIKDMVGEGPAGIYALAYSVSMIMVFFNGALQQSIGPWIYQKIKAHQTKDIAPVAYLTLVINALINTGLIFLGPEVIRIFAPGSYYEAIWVIPPVAMSVYFMYCYDLFAKFAFYYEKTKSIMFASVVGAGLNVVLNYIFIKMFGYIAAGYTTLICYMIYSGFHYMFMRRVCRECNDGVYPYETRKIMYITIPFLVVGLGALFTYRLPVLRYSILAVAFVLVIIYRKRIISVLMQLSSLKKSKVS